MRKKSILIRKFKDYFVKSISTISAVIGLFFLVWILWTVFSRGVSALDLDFFTKLPTPPGVEGGGLANAILGTLLITLGAAAFAVPVGLLGGVYLAEFGKQGKYANLVRFVTNVLVGVPSIIVGVFVFGLMVLPMKGFSGYAGAASLAVIMLPVVVRTTEDILSLVPSSLRESALAIGASRWRVTLQIVFREARSGLLTGILLAIARVSGETAPLLFTALNSPYWFNSFHEPVSNLTVTIFNYAMSPYEDWQAKAWGASLLITAAILFVTIVARVLIKSQGTKS